MITPTSHYETVYILRPGVAESDASVVHQKVDSVISKFGGQLTHRDDWGIKELAYRISREGSGRFVIMQYTGKGGVVEEIERHFKILNEVIRFITVKVDARYDYAKVKKQLHATEEEIHRIRDLKKMKAY